MPSGYERSYDYNHPKMPGGRLVALAIFAFIGTYVWLSWPTEPSCWTLGSDEITFETHGSRKIAVLDLTRIPSGECVKIQNVAQPSSY